MFGQYATFIIPSYAITFVVIAGLILWVSRTHAVRRSEAARLEALVGRRGRPASAKSASQVTDSAKGIQQ